MKSFEEKLKKVSKEIKMTSAEKASVRARIAEDMRTAPTPVYSWGFLFFVRRHFVGASLVAVLFFGGAISSFAEKSLPGDLLYPFKIGVNEQVMGWFAGSKEARGKWQLSLAERRLDEIDRLQAGGFLTLHSKLEIESRLERHANEAEAHVSSNAGSGAEDARSAGIEDSISTAMTFTAESEMKGKEFMERDIESVREEIKTLRGRAEKIKENVSSLEKRRIADNWAKSRLHLVRAREALLKAEDSIVGGAGENVQKYIQDAESRLTEIEMKIQETGAFNSDSDSDSESGQREEEDGVTSQTGDGLRDENTGIELNNETETEVKISL